MRYDGPKIRGADLACAIHPCREDGTHHQFRRGRSDLHVSKARVKVTAAKRWVPHQMRDTAIS